MNTARLVWIGLCVLLTIAAITLLIVLLVRNQDNCGACKKPNPNKKEKYGGPVTLPLNKWRKYVASGKNTLYGSGGVIPGGTVTTAFGGNGAVFAGTVRQGIGY